MAETRYLGENLPIVVQFDSNPLTIYGKAYSDITQISMNLKRDKATDDDDAYLERKSVSDDDGVVLTEATHKFTMKMDDYQSAGVGYYHLVIGIKVTGIDDMIEPELKDDSVRIIPDKQRL